MDQTEWTAQLELCEVGRQQVYQIPAGCPDGNDAQLLNAVKDFASMKCWFFLHGNDRLDDCD